MEMGFQELKFDLFFRQGQDLAPPRVPQFQGRVGDCNGAAGPPRFGLLAWHGRQGGNRTGAPAAPSEACSGLGQG